jgi:hypothetical protein
MSKEFMSWDEVEDGFRDALDIDGNIKIGGVELAPSLVLMRCDYIAYREGLNDYADMLSEDYEIEGIL